MFRRLKSSKDTAITNAIVNGSRVEDANIGLAGVLPLFKIYGESQLTNQTGSYNEYSRILIKFDLDPLRSLTGSIFNYSSTAFTATLKLYDVVAGQTRPSNFTTVVYPLSKSFDEGRGFDTYEFKDIDTVNFITASTTQIWDSAGANASGTLGASNIDIIETGNLGAGTVNIFKTQSFVDGSEDLSINITTIVSATLAGLIPDHGFLIAFSGTQQTDDKTRFAKLFSSRHVNNPAKRPSINIVFDDTVQDDHKHLIFDVSGTLFFNNFHFGQPANLVFNGATITGSNCLSVRFVSGSGSTFFQKTITGSQYSINNNFITGVYYINFAIGMNETGSLLNEVKLAQSATFSEIWQTLSGNFGFITSSLVVKTPFRTTFDNIPGKMIAVISNNRGVYKAADKPRFNLYIQDETVDLIAKKRPLLKPSIVSKQTYYQIRDYNSNEIIVPFDNTGTKMSVADDGMYFELYMEDLYPGRVYGIEIKFNYYGVEHYFTMDDVGAIFRVEN